MKIPGMLREVIGSVLSSLCPGVPWVPGVGLRVREPDFRAVCIGVSGLTGFCCFLNRWKLVSEGAG